MSFLYMIIMGLVVGVLARAIKPGANPMGWILTIVLGIVGALVGGWLSTLVGIGGGLLVNLGFSVVGAILVLVIYEFITGCKLQE